MDVCLELLALRPANGFISQALGRGLAALDGLCQAHLVGGRQQRHPTDLAEVQGHRFARAIAGRGFEGGRVTESEPAIRPRV